LGIEASPARPPAPPTAQRTPTGTPRALPRSRSFPKLARQSPQPIRPVSGDRVGQGILGAIHDARESCGAVVAKAAGHQGCGPRRSERRSPEPACCRCHCAPEPPGLERPACATRPTRRAGPRPHCCSRTTDTSPRYGESCECFIWRSVRRLYSRRRARLSSPRQAAFTIERSSAAPGRKPRRDGLRKAACRRDAGNLTRGVFFEKDSFFLKLDEWPGEEPRKCSGDLAFERCARNPLTRCDMTLFRLVDGAQRQLTEGNDVCEDADMRGQAET